MLGSIDHKLGLRPGIGRDRPRRGLGAWSPTTPFALRIGMVLACVPLVALGLTIRVAIERNDAAIDTVGEDATRGITVAQEIKTNLAELDQLVVMGLLPGAADGDVETAYAAKRRDVMTSLARGSAETASSAAYRDALVNLDYALGHYHSLVAESLAAQAAGDHAGAVAKYGQAHEVMAGTLLPEADFVDKANTYLLNTTYDRHAGEAADSATAVWIAGLVAAGVLVLAQVLLMTKFRRALNPALLVATLLVAGLCVTVVHDLDTSADELGSATGESFEAVHALARARAVAVTARQAEAQWLLQPTIANRRAFDEAVHRLYRLPEEEGSVLDSLRLHLPDDAGGFMAAAVFAGGNDASAPAMQTLEPFARFVRADNSLRSYVADRGVDPAMAQFRTSSPYGTFVRSIDEAQRTEQADFDRTADKAREATSRERGLTVAVIAAVVLLALGGLYARLREYRR
jgi:hypothetical protein